MIERCCAFTGQPHRHRRPTSPLAVVDSQQTGGVIDQIAVALQHTALTVLPAQH